jgi:MoaA/NifB/PqqE/SkfB family radical SAM enzyme
LSLVVSATYRCNSRCLTCNVWRKEAEEMRLEEWRRAFAHIGKTPYYITFSGGEPFLRADLVELVAAAYQECRPAIITIPTNGLLPRVPRQVEEIVKACPEAQVGINLSLDEIGERHDAIRGVEGNYRRALETYQALRSIDRPNLVLGIHTVISRFNVQRLPEIYRELRELGADSYIAEIAEEREELGTVGMDITPAVEDYARAADYLIAELRRNKAWGWAKTTQAFRVHYYELTKRIMAQRRQVIPCYAGFASGHIAPNGDVWTCCTRAQPVGNLRQTDYRLAPIWFGERAEELRRSIAAGECYCPMANAAYTNMLLHFPTLWRVFRTLLAR